MATYNGESASSSSHINELIAENCIPKDRSIQGVRFMCTVEEMASMPSFIAQLKSNVSIQFCKWTKCRTYIETKGKKTMAFFKGYPAVVDVVIVDMCPIPEKDVEGVFGEPLPSKATQYNKKKTESNQHLEDYYLFILNNNGMIPNMDGNVDFILNRQVILKV